jgi:hypothetical protein
MENITIDKLSFWLYDYLYNKNYKTYQIDNITLNFSYDDIVYNPKNLEDSENQSEILINDIFNTTVKYSDKINDIYIFKRTYNPYSTDICIKKSESKDLNTTDNMNIAMNYILSDLVIKRLTKHILLNIFNTDINVKDLVLFLKLHNIDEEWLQDLKYIQVTIREHFFKLDELEKVFNDNTTEEEYAHIFFQLLHTLAIIQKKYKTFRHNNLTPKTIYYYKKGKSSDTSYIFEDTQFILNNNSLDIKIYNFDKSIIIDVYDNSDLTEEEKVKDQTYDYKYFFKNLLKLKLKLPESIKEFINDIFKNNITPTNIILTHKFFNNLRK